MWMNVPAIPTSVAKMGSVEMHLEHSTATVFPDTCQKATLVGAHSNLFILNTTFCTDIVCNNTTPDL